MKNGKIMIVTGSPGTGKTTISSLLVKRPEFEKSVHMHTDEFYGFLRNGYIPPHLPGSSEQNEIVAEAFLEAAKCFSRGGYHVVVDGVIGPWMLRPWISAARAGYEVHYMIIRANKEETLKRAVNREKLDQAMNTELVECMWEQFQGLKEYEKYTMDTTNFSIEETAAKIMVKLNNKEHVL